MLLATIIILTGLIPSATFAENTNDKKTETVVVKVKELFNISDKYDEFTSNLSSYDGMTYLYLNWVDTTGKLNNINVNVDIEGNIISYDSYPPVYKEPSGKLPKYSKTEAQKLVMDFIQKVDSTIANEIKSINENDMDYYQDTNYYFSFARYVNDIVFPQNTVSISFNKYTGEINSYNTNWDRKLEFPSPDKKLSLDKGKEAFKSQIGIHPIFKIRGYYHRDEKDTINKHYLAYSTIISNAGIDAFTGEKVNIDYYGAYNDREAKAMDNEVKEESGLTTAEMESLDKLSGLLDEETAEKKAREMFNIESSFVTVRKNLYESYKNPGEYNWYMYFVKEISKDKSQYIDITIDAKTGEVLNFYKSIDYNPDAKPTVNREKALDIAKEYIKDIQPNKVMEIELMDDANIEEDQVSYFFQFNRKQDGIYVESDRVNVAIDAVSGEVYSYTLEWYNGKLPLKDNLIPLDNAYEILWDRIGLELKYIKIFKYDRIEGEQSEIKLVYALKQDKPSIISGTTGELLDYNGEPYVERKPISYNDIEDSYAKDKIKNLAQYGVGFNEETFKPKEKIKQKDFIYLLWKSLNPYRIENISEEKIYNEFINLGYMKEEEKNPEKIVIKEEGVKYILRIMKLDKVAEIEGIYKDIFKDEKDISEELKGYINIAYGLKIISGDNAGSIKPKYELKREDAASMVYNYMFN